MSIHNLDRVFRPSSVAILGASEKEGTIGDALMKNLMKGGYQGRIYPVNPGREKVHGIEAYPSLLKISQSVDLAVIATPISTVPAIMEECVKIGVGGAVVISAGGKEIGEKGKKIERQIERIALSGGVRIIGPNCLGITATESRLNTSFASHMPLPGRLAFISQSGAICTAILDVSLKERIGFSYFVSIGSMLDVDFGDLINYLGNDPDVSSIVLYIESLTNFRKFMSAARAVSRVKPIVVLKSGRSAAGAKAAASHTGSLAGADDVYDAAFKRAGVVRVNTIEELFDCAELMAKQPRPGGSGLGIVTNAGGPGVMATDALAQYGLEPAALTDRTIERLNNVLPRFWSRANPIDIIGDANAERYRNAVEICLTAPEINSLLIIMAPQAMTNPTLVAQGLVEIIKQKRIPIFTVWMGAADAEKGRDIFNEAGIPTYETPERAVTAFMYMYSHMRNLELSQQVPQKLPQDPEFDRIEARRIIEETLQRGEKLLTESDSKKLLAAYGIPVTRTEVAESGDEAAVLANGMGFPVVMKIHSPDISHKSDAGGVVLNLKDERAVRDAFDMVMSSARAYDPKARLSGVTIQPMLKKGEYELIVGCKKDPDFGPVILFGMGGIMTEILKDRAIALPPLNRLLARRLIEGTKVYKLLRGYRNIPPANLMLIEEVLIRLSQLVTDLPEIVEMDINPLVAVEDKVFALDARVVVEPSCVPPPMHLVISPYPAQYEKETVTRGNIEILMRPIKPEDAPLLIDLFHAMSPRSIYFRFFRPMKELSPDMLARFTQIDYDRDVALVAIERTDAGERMLGVARLMGDPDVTKAEFSVVVGDPWHGLGVGAALLEHCLMIGKDRGYKFVWGVVLPENTNMIALGRKLGFNIAREPESTDYELSIHLDAGIDG
ncbi:MAG: GNAT family N-acetyltransferase [Acidobacteriota bacterium]